MASKPSHKRPARPGSKPAVVAPAERTPLVWSDAQWASWRAAPRIGALLRTRAGAIPLVALKAPLSSAYAEQVDEGRLPNGNKVHLKVVKEPLGGSVVG